MVTGRRPCCRRWTTPGATSAGRPAARSWWSGGRSGIGSTAKADWSSAHATFGPHGLIDGVPVEYSERLGIYKDPIHKDSLGPKGHVPEEFLDFGVVAAGQTVSFRAAFKLADAARHDGGGRRHLRPRSC